MCLRTYTSYPVEKDLLNLTDLAFATKNCASLSPGHALVTGSRIMSILLSAGAAAWPCEAGSPGA